MKPNYKCIYCEKPLFNLDYHVYTSHKNVIKSYLNDVHNISLNKCNICGDDIIPIYSRREKKFKYNTKYGKEQVVCTKCLDGFNGVKQFREKLITCYGLSNKEAEDIYKNINENKKLLPDVFVKKYGEEIGSKRYEDYKKSISGRYSVSWWSKKYPQNWKQKRDSWLKSVRISLNDFIRKFGKKEGKKRYDLFRSRCSIKNKDYRIQKFGKEEYENQIDKYNKRKNPVSFDYFLEKYNWDYNKAKLEYRKRQQTISLEKFMEKYGGVAGRKRYESVLNKTLFHFSSTSHSIPQKVLSDEIRKRCQSDKVVMYDYSNPYLFYTTKNVRDDINQKVIIPDVYIKPINLAIEFYGDFWHANPLIYKEHDILYGKFVRDIWEHDHKKMSFLKDYYKLDIIIVWESDFSINGLEIINNIEKKIYERIGEIAG